MRKLLLGGILALAVSALPPVLTAQGSEFVRETQQALKNKGFDPGPVDGRMGQQTRAALRSYQQKNNLRADGRLSNSTLDSLGVKHDTAGGHFETAGSNVRHSYVNGGREFGEGGQALGSGVKHGHVVEGAKGFGKGVGLGTAKIGLGTGQAAKNLGKGVKDAVSGNK